MARRLRPVGIEFVETAPVRLVFAREISAPPEAVFHALAEDVPGWAGWFSAVTLARPVDDGARREIRLRGGTRFEESVLMATSPEVYAYRVDVTNAPGLRALVEEWRLTAAGTGTRVQWTFAAGGTPPLRLALRLARAGLGLAFRDAVTTLDRRLAAR
ncbi:SRPBCC family protein [Streptomyces sp. HUCO-GS316]|uniref:SRPBCC family protein n=1 Tax=Streptomyces sp. HUCO-GS316 TaxID=2692198 RepID=UPI00136B174D|nr:SRPBCC family protein [Streptomyces sp. HUCO-GS316]MXM66563.1 SRPBCC family protein [Streptomyces sp. HUCO-GS316]